MIDYEARQQILILTERVFELQDLSLSLLGELKALKNLLIVQLATSEEEKATICATLQKSTDQYLDILLGSVADENMNAASELKQKIENLRKKKPE